MGTWKNLLILIVICMLAYFFDIYILKNLLEVTHIVGLAILNPFDSTPSGISLGQITRTIEINLLDTLGG